MTIGAYLLSGLTACLTGIGMILIMVLVIYLCYTIIMWGTSSPKSYLQNKAPARAVAKELFSPVKEIEEKKLEFKSEFYKLYEPSGRKFKKW